MIIISSQSSTVVAQRYLFRLTIGQAIG